MTRFFNTVSIWVSLFDIYLTSTLLPRFQQFKRAVATDTLVVAERMIHDMVLRKASRADRNEIEAFGHSIAHENMIDESARGFLNNADDFVSTSPEHNSCPPLLHRLIFCQEQSWFVDILVREHTVSHACHTAADGNRNDFSTQLALEVYHTRSITA